MTEGVQRLTAAVVHQSVASAVASELGRSALGRRDVEERFWSGIRQEVERLREVVADQAEKIAELQAGLDQARQQVHRLEMRELVGAVSSAVLSSAAAIDGYVINDAHVQVRAAIEIDSGRVTMTADPGGLLDAAGLSTFDVHLRPLPPPPAETPLLQALDVVRAAAAELQVALGDARLDTTPRAAALRAVADLVTEPSESGLWERLVPALEGVAGADERVADSGRAAVAAARETAAGVSARTLAAAGQALHWLAVHLRQLRG